VRGKGLGERRAQLRAGERLLEQPPPRLEHRAEVDSGEQRREVAVAAQLGVEDRLDESRPVCAFEQQLPRERGAVQLTVGEDGAQLPVVEKCW